MIVIIDYGMGNVKSIERMLLKIGFSVKVSCDVSDIENATCLILPGVGHFKTAMDELNRKGLVGVLNRLVLCEEKPIIGICLGMQLMCKFSEEGDVEGLCWVDASVKKIPPLDSTGKSIPVPHMGWSDVTIEKDHNLIVDMPHNRNRFYFVHSYYVDCNDNDIWLSANYHQKFCCAFKKDNIAGMQFHPEKSHKYGMTLLKNLCERVINVK